MMEKTYIEYFTPLIQEFVCEVESLSHPNISRIPEPHLPLFGKSYEHSALRLIVIGQDTLGWGDLHQFIAAEKANPGCKLREGLAEFRDYSLFRRSKATAGPQRFLGFMMMIVAALHGQDEWELMKEGKLLELMDSMSWAEANAVELHSGSPKTLGVPLEYWDRVRAAADRFNRFRHIVQTLKPNAALILYRGFDPETYFEGLDHEVVWREGRLTHYRLNKAGVDVFHGPHPKSMNMIEGIDHFRTKITELFGKSNKALPFPKFVSGGNDEVNVMRFFEQNAPAITSDFDKFAFVAWVANELKKREAFMSVPALIRLVNAKGGKTNYGETFSGGRGSYRLVSGAYWRMEQGGFSQEAQNIALSFRRSNFEYAFDTN
jgi:hypothetical protein